MKNIGKIMADALLKYGEDIAAYLWVNNRSEMFDVLCIPDRKIKAVSGENDIDGFWEYIREASKKLKLKKTSPKITSEIAMVEYYFQICPYGMEIDSWFGMMICRGHITDEAVEQFKKMKGLSAKKSNNEIDISGLHVTKKVVQSEVFYGKMMSPSVENKIIDHLNEKANEGKPVHSSHWGYVFVGNTMHLKKISYCPFCLEKKLNNETVINCNKSIDAESCYKKFNQIAEKLFHDVFFENHQEVKPTKDLKIVVTATDEELKQAEEFRKKQQEEVMRKRKEKEIQKKREEAQLKKSQQAIAKTLKKK